MKKTYQVYDFVKQGEDLDEYMDRQPRMLPTFDRHAEAETALFKEMGLLCQCDDPVLCVEPANTDARCTACGLPLLRLTVLAAERRRNNNE